LIIHWNYLYLIRTELNSSKYCSNFSGVFNANLPALAGIDVSNLISSSWQQLTYQVNESSQQFSNNPTAEKLLNFENSIHKQFLQLADQVTKEILTQAISAPQLIQQAIDQYRSNGYYVNSRKKRTTVQLLGGMVIQIETVFVIYLYPDRQRSNRKYHKTSC